MREQSGRERREACCSWPRRYQRGGHATFISLRRRHSRCAPARALSSASNWSGSGTARQRGLPSAICHPDRRSLPGRSRSPYRPRAFLLAPEKSSAAAACGRTGRRSRCASRPPRASRRCPCCCRSLADADAEALLLRAAGCTRRCRRCTLSAACSLAGEHAGAAAPRLSLSPPVADRAASRRVALPQPACSRGLTRHPPAVGKHMARERT